MTPAQPIVDEEYYRDYVAPHDATDDAFDVTDKAFLGDDKLGDLFRDATALNAPPLLLRWQSKEYTSRRHIRET